MISFLSFWFIVHNREISINAQANLSKFSIKSSFTSMDFKSSNDATDERKGGIFGEYPNGGEASSQIVTDMDS